MGYINTCKHVDELNPGNDVQKRRRLLRDSACDIPELECRLLNRFLVQQVEGAGALA